MAPGGRSRKGLVQAQTNGAIANDHDGRKNSADWSGTVSAADLAALEAPG